MKISFIYFLLIVFATLSCEQEEINPVIPLPEIVIQGNPIDTAYLYTTYNDPGANYFEDNNDRWVNDGDFIKVTDVSGVVDTKLPGTCYLKYNAKNSEGKTLATVTRTIHVIENPTAFLNGNYNVACTCTTTAGPISTSSSQNYTASVWPNPGKNYFDLMFLNIGAEKIVPITSLSGNSITIHHWSPDYDNSSSASGTLSATKNSFTIDTKFHRYTPRVTYTCRNIYTRQLVLN